MKKKQWILINTLFVFLLSTVVLSAQRGNDYGHDYNDDIIVVTDYDGPNYHRGDRDRPRGKSRVAQDRNFKRNIMHRAYRIAESDGRITRGERRELRRLEQDLGIYRQNNRRGHRGHDHRGYK